MQQYVLQIIEHLEEMGYKKQLPYEKELIKAYEVRLKEYEILEEAKKHEK